LTGATRGEASAMMGSMQEISVGPEGIRLGQLLKLANLVESGGEVRPLLAQGGVTVNGAVETRRGAQLRAGDVVAIGDAQIKVT
jgi:ribosome-associated protein